MTKQAAILRLFWRSPSAASPANTLLEEIIGIARAILHCCMLRQQHHLAKGLYMKAGRRCGNSAGIFWKGLTLWLIDELMLPKSSFSILYTVLIKNSYLSWFYPNWWWHLLIFINWLTQKVVHFDNVADLGPTSDTEPHRNSPANKATQSFTARLSKVLDLSGLHAICNAKQSKASSFPSS